MRMWVRSPHTGGKQISPTVKTRTERRIQEHAKQHHPGKFTRVEVRFHGAFCYIDGYTEPHLPKGSRPPAGETREEWLDRLRNTPTHLCRLRYFGNEDRWSFAWYTYAHERYERSFLMTGSEHGTPEEAFDTCTLFY